MSTPPRTLILSQDYELFFKDSGSIDKCLFDPCDALLDFATMRGLKFTFFIDVGMLTAMERIAAKVRGVGKDLTRIKRHVGEIAAGGHEIALHIHPHWEETDFADGEWQFSNTRYQLRDFSQDEVERIVTSYARYLGELAGTQPTSYRAGGFCTEPFASVGRVLARNGIQIDSSVVPGARLIDTVKGFDFAHAPDNAYWLFDDCPAIPTHEGQFVEVPVTPLKVAPLFYWNRAIDRLAGKRTRKHFGDGLSKAIGRVEILRRLTARSRVSELSMDDAKAEHLLQPGVVESDRSTWHIMGHPKLASRNAIEIVGQFIDRMHFSDFETVTSFAARVRTAKSTQ